MNKICGAEALVDEIKEYLTKLSDGKRLSKLQDKKFRSILDQYWDVECPEGKTCRPNTCLMAKPDDWIDYHGYTSLGELLWYFDYQDIEVLELKNRKSIDILDVPGIRSPGSVFR